MTVVFLSDDGVWVSGVGSWIKRKRLELLAPGGTLEKLKWAAVYGADAVYFGAPFGSLRNFAGNLSREEMAEGLAFLHRLGKRGYLALNIYPFSEEYDKILDVAQQFDEMGGDAVIVSDLGVLHQMRKLALNAALHVSTQANTTSWQAALAYKDLGARRVNLARELSLARIRHIREMTQGKIETEVFAHGAVCFSMSGRCAISDYLTGFGSNHGECKHPCRWRYALVEESRPGEYMPVFEDDRGCYLFNSKDLALVEFVPALEHAGVDALKIEGRMKSVHYVASVVWLYRQILDGKRFSPKTLRRLLDRVSNRGYSSGFMKGEIVDADYDRTRSRSEGAATFVGLTTETSADGTCVLAVKNKLHGGETLEVLSPAHPLFTVTLPKFLTTTDDRTIGEANNPQYLRLPFQLAPYTILRRVDGEFLR